MCRKAFMLYLGAALVLGGVAAGCGDDDDAPVDAGRDSGPRTDANIDTGVGVDGGCIPSCDGLECGDDGCGGTCGDPAGCPGGLACADGACPRTVFARLAHLVPNAGGIRLCVYLSAGGTPLGAPIGPLLRETPAPDDVDYIPFRGVSGYTDLFTADPVDYGIRAYSIADVTTECPALDAADPAPVFEDTVSGSSLSPGQFYTITALGFANESDGSAPMFCGATRDAACTGDQLAHIIVFDDDPTPPAADTDTKLRFLHGVPNMGVLDICYDSDTTDDTNDLVELFDNVAFPAATDYLEIAPMPGADENAALTIHINIPGLTDALTCPAVDVPGAGINTQIATIALPYPAASGVGTAAVPGSVASFEANAVATIFASGNAAISSPDPAAGGVLVVPFADAIPGS